MRIANGLNVRGSGVSNGLNPLLFFVVIDTIGFLLYITQQPEFDLER